MALRRGLGGRLLGFHHFQSEAEHSGSHPRVLAGADAQAHLAIRALDLDHGYHAADLVVVPELGFDRVHLLSDFLHQPGPRVSLSAYLPCLFVMRVWHLYTLSAENPRAQDDATRRKLVAARYRPRVARGRLITIEGIDGAGKTTLAQALAHELERLGAPVELMREPGGVELSERIRDLVKDPQLQVGARAEALLYAAARAQLVQERVLPLLDDGALVLLDRFVDSSLAYQGAGRGLGVQQVRAVNLFATGGLTPDRTLFLRIAPESGRLRQQERALQADRLEQEGEDFFTAIADCYEELAIAEPERFRTIDASQSPARVLELSVDAVRDLLPPDPSLA